MITIKAIDLVSIAVAAEIWFKKQNQITNSFIVELKAATELKKALYKVQWDKDAKLTINESGE